MFKELIRGRSPRTKNRRRFWFYVVFLLIFVAILGLAANQLAMRRDFQYSVRCMNPEFETLVLFLDDEDATEYIMMKVKANPLTICQKATFNLNELPKTHEDVLKRVEDKR